MAKKKFSEDITKNLQWSLLDLWKSPMKELTKNEEEEEDDDDDDDLGFKYKRVLSIFVSS